MASAIVPAIYDPGLADESLEVATEDAHALTCRLAREAGLFVGPSSGAALAGCLEVARTLRHGVIVTVFPDGGDRYLSEPFWSAPALVLTQEPESAIRAHAAETYPHECCGALIGSRGTVTLALPLGNISEAGRERRFLVSPLDYQRAEATAESAGADLLGFYHSHPNHPAVPSAFDLQHAWPNLSYVIVSAGISATGSAESGALRSWRLRQDRSAFDEEKVSTSCQ